MAPITHDEYTILNAAAKAMFNEKVLSREVQVEKLGSWAQVYGMRKPKLASLQIRTSIAQSS